MTSVALTIAGSDPSGGAGIQADLKTFHRFGVYGTAVITLITVQNTLRVSRVEVLPPDLVFAQIQSVLDDLPPQAMKTGALGNAAIIDVVLKAVASNAGSFPLIVDPVMISKHGARLIDGEATEALRRLLPYCTLVTPNLYEAEVLAGMEVLTLSQMEEAARRISQIGAPAVLVKGGHLEGEPLDLLYAEGDFHVFSGTRYQTAHTHGTGCTYSAAITAGMASGLGLKQAIQQAKSFIDEAIRTNPGLGSGNGPVNHWASFEGATL